MTIPAFFGVLRQPHSPKRKYHNLATAEEQRPPEKTSENPSMTAEPLPTRAKITRRPFGHVQLSPSLNQNDHVQELAHDCTLWMRELSFVVVPKTSKAHRTTPQDYNDVQVMPSQRELPPIALHVQAEEATCAISKSPVAPDKYVMCLAQDITLQPVPDPEEVKVMPSEHP